MANDLDLKLVVKAQVDRALRAIRNLKKEINGTGSSARKLGEDGSAGGKRLRSALDGVKDSAEKTKKEFLKGITAAKGLWASIIALTGGVIVKRFVSVNVELEKQQKSFEAIKGSAALAANEMDFVRRVANQLGQDIDVTANTWVSLLAASKGTRLEGQQARDVFVAVSRAMSVLGKSAAETQGALLAIEQMISKGKVSAEELRGQLGERLPGAFILAARAIGVTTAQLDEMLAAGRLTAEELLPKLAAELNKSFGSTEKIESFAAAWTRLQNTTKRAVRQLDESLGIMDKIQFVMGRIEGHLSNFAPATRIDAIKLEIQEREKLVRIMQEQNSSLVGFFNRDLNEQEIADHRTALQALYNQLADIQKQAIKDERQIVSQRAALDRIATFEKEHAAATQKAVEEQKLKDIELALRKQEAVYASHLLRIKNLLKEEQDIQKEFAGLTKELLAPKAKQQKTEGLTPRDVNAEIGSAYIKLSDGDLKGAIETARRAGDMLRQMREEGNYTRLTLAGIAGDLERVAKIASERKTGKALIEADKEKQEVDKIKALYERVKAGVEKSPINVPLLADEKKFSEQLAALRARVEATPITIKVTLDGRYTKFSGENTDSGDIAITGESFEEQVTRELLARGSR